MQNRPESCNSDGKQHLPYTHFVELASHFSSLLSFLDALKCQIVHYPAAFSKHKREEKMMQVDDMF